MKIFEVPTPIFKQEIKEHYSIKKSLLNYFENRPDENVSNEDVISKTDWQTSQIMNKDYIEYFVPQITPYIKNVGKQLHAVDCKIIGMWYQQYLKNDKHNWHTHGGVNWANIYYVELPETNMNTEFYDIVNKKILKSIDIKEGDFITFPANMIHRSPQNISNKRKSIVSFNCDFDVRL